MKWWKIVTFIAVASIAFSVVMWSLAKLDSDRNNFDDCDNIYEAGECQLYECKMNYSSSIHTSNMMYELYHTCIINNDAEVAFSETKQNGGENGKIN